jgi:hypothetical protein
MRELTYLVATSIDGFIAAPDGDITPLLVEGAHLEALVERYPRPSPHSFASRWASRRRIRSSTPSSWARTPTGSRAPCRAPTHTCGRSS